MAPTADGFNDRVPVPDPVPDTNPVALLRVGDSAAFLEYFGPNLDGAWTLAKSECGGDQELATEATRTAFLLSWARIDELTQWEQFTVWLYSVVRSQARVAAKSNKRQRNQEMLTSTPAPDDAQGLIGTALKLLNTEDRELVELSLRFNFDAEQVCRIIANPQSTNSAERMVANAMQRLLDGLAALLLFVDPPDCDQRQRDTGKDTGFNPLTRTRLVRHARTCQTCGGSFAKAAQLLEMTPMRADPAPEQLRVELFHQSDAGAASPPTPPATAQTPESSAVERSPSEPEYLSLGASSLPGLTPWQQGQRLAKSVPQFDRSGWPKARPPGRVQRLLARR